MPAQTLKDIERSYNVKIGKARARVRRATSNEAKLKGLDEVRNLTRQLQRDLEALTHAELAECR